MFAIEWEKNIFDACVREKLRTIFSSLARVRTLSKYDKERRLSILDVKNYFVYKLTYAVVYLRKTF